MDEAKQVYQTEYTSRMEEIAALKAEKEASQASMQSEIGVLRRDMEVCSHEGSVHVQAKAGCKVWAAFEMYILEA